MIKSKIKIYQYGVVREGFLEDTDFVDWIIIDYIKGWDLNSEVKRHPKQPGFVWIDFCTLILRLPLIKINNIVSISLRLTKLEKLGLLEKLRDRQGRCYVRLTPRCHQVFIKENSVEEIYHFNPD